jgi:hypothetical protein
MADYYNEGNISVACPSWAPGVGFMGCVMAVAIASEFMSYDKNRLLSPGW